MCCAHTLPADRAEPLPQALCLSELSHGLAGSKPTGVWEPRRGRVRRASDEGQEEGTRPSKERPKVLGQAFYLLIQE